MPNHKEKDFGGKLLSWSQVSLTVSAGSNSLQVKMNHLSL